MPLPAIAIPLISAAASLGGQGINAAVQGSMNKKTRQWNEQQYTKQRQDNLADWRMQNEYNDPTAVMARLRKAGLNPNLVYGDGASMPSVAMRSADTPSWQPKAPEVDFQQPAGELFRYYDIQMKEAQTNNLKAQNNAILEETNLKKAQTAAALAAAANTQVGTSRAQFDLAMQNSLRDFNLEAAALSNQQARANIQGTLSRTETENAMRAPNLTKAVEEILNLRLSRAKTRAEISQIFAYAENLKKQGKLYDLDINLKENGIQPGDPAWMRALIQLLGKGDGTILDKATEGLTNKVTGYDKPKLKSFRKAKPFWVP